MPLNIATIVAKNYLAHARTLVESFLKHNPDGRAFVLLVDRVDGFFEPSNEKFTLHILEDLLEVIPDVQGFAFQYSVMELATAAKPYYLNYLFENYQCEKLCYIDPDILVCHNLSKLENILDENSVVLTPHLTSPIDDSLRPSEVDILLSGTYNLGFIGLKNDPLSKQLLGWWENRLHEKCIVDIARGYFVDQKWMDLVPGFYEKVFILRDPGYNVAYWNLHERRLAYTQEGILCNGEILYFFHFSGFNPDVPQVVSKHQTRFSMAELGPTRRIFEEYADFLRTNGYEYSHSWPYAFACFDNGVRIPQQARSLYLNLGKKRKEYENPFSTTRTKSFLDWLISSDERQIPPLFRDIYDSRSDLQGAFPRVEAEDRIPFYIWILSDGKVQHDLDESLLQGIILDGQNNCNELKLAEDAARKRMRVKSMYHQLKRYHFLNPMLEKLKPFVKSRIMKINRTIVPGPSTLLPPSLAAENSQLSSDKRGVNLAGYFQAETGMGMAVRSDVNSLDAAEIPYILNNFRDSGSLNNVNSTIKFSENNPYNINLIHVNADQIPFFIQEKGNSYIQGHYTIGRWEWELSQFPIEWQGSFDNLDEIWVASNFALDSIARVSPIPVVRMPHTIKVDPEDLLISKNHDEFDVSSNNYVFLFMFDFRSFMARKNPIGLINAFKKAFSTEEQVVLVIKCSHAESCPDEFAQMEESARNHNIKIINQVIESKQVKSLQATADCYVSLHRSEGFGLTMAESMAFGKPVIATAYSGNMDFMTLSNSYLVKYDLTEIDQDYGPYKKGMVWAEPDIDDATRLMRYVYENQEEAKCTGAMAASYIREHLSPENVGQMYADRINYIMEHEKKSESIDKNIDASLTLQDECQEYGGSYDFSHLVAYTDIVVDSIPVDSKHRLTGPIRKLLKRAGRKSTYWLMKPLFKQVSQFNHEVVQILQLLNENNRNLTQKNCINDNVAETLRSNLMIEKEINDQLKQEIKALAQDSHHLKYNQLRNIELSLEDQIKRDYELRENLLTSQNKYKEDISQRFEESQRELSELGLKVDRIAVDIGQQSEKVINVNDKLVQMVVATERIEAELHPLVYYNHDYLPVPSKSFDYFGFEQMFRGTKELLQSRLKQYLSLFAKGQRVLDVGCGLGDFMELLKESEIVASGVDIDQEMVRECKKKGFDVSCDDFEKYLDNLPEQSIEGVFSAQFIEHLTAERIDAFIKKSYSRLAWGGKFVTETINPYNVPNSRFFYVDPTHEKPIFPEVARFMCLSAGFRDVRIQYIACFGETRAELREPWDYCDYAVIAIK